METYQYNKLTSKGELIGTGEMSEYEFKAIYNETMQSVFLNGGQIRTDHNYYIQLAQRDKPNTTQQILDQRQSQYGEYADVARITQEIKQSLQSGASYASLSDGQKLALDMIANKMARAVNGDVTYQDNYEDICGYSQLVLDELKNK